MGNRRFISRILQNDLFRPAEAGPREAADAMEEGGRLAVGVSPTFQKTAFSRVFLVPVAEAEVPREAVG